MSTNELFFWFSLPCPYSYIGWEVLKRTLPEGLSVHLIGVDLPENFRFLQFPGPVSEMSAMRWKRLEERAAGLNLPLKKPVFPINSSNGVLRGFKKYGYREQKIFLDALFRGVFSGEMNLNDRQQIAETLQKAGLDPQPFLAGPDDIHSQHQVELDIKNWEREINRLVPRVRYGDDVYSGMMDQRGLERFFQCLAI